MGILDAFKRGLEKTRNFVSSGFTKIAASTGHFDEDQLDELEEILVRADCGVGASTDIIDHVKDNIKKSGDDSKEAVMASVKEKMLEILGPKSSITLEEGKLNIILMIGVNGTGKTTTAGKLCEKYKKQGKKVILGAADTFRAAAIEQLKVWVREHPLLLSLMRQVLILHLFVMMPFMLLSLEKQIFSLSIQQVGFIIRRTSWMSSPRSRGSSTEKLRMPTSRVCL